MPDAAMRALIIDDEPPARGIIREYLQDVPEVDLIGECGNGREAVARINAEAPGLVFLDVQMPSMNGFEVLERLDGSIPRLIFSTAYDRYALDAFEAGAVDYLLKPYSRARFEKAVRRALQQPATDAHAQRLMRLLDAARPTPHEAPAFADRLLVKSGSRIVPVATDRIRYVEAAGDYAELHLADGSRVLCGLGIGGLEERLDPARFIRIHRSYLLAVGALQHLESDGEGGYHVLLDDGTRLRVSRTYAPQLRALIV